MSSFADFARGLLPSFKRSKITESIGLTLTRLNTHTLPSYLQADDSGVFNSPKSSEVKERLAKIAYASSRRPVAGRGSINLIRHNLENASKLLDILDKRAKVLFSETETNLGLTYAKATALRLIQVIDQYESYAGLFLNYCLFEETKATNSAAASGKLTKAELATLDAGFDQFVASGVVLEKEVKLLEAALKSIPDAQVTKDGEQVLRATAGDAKLDPLSLRNLNASANPFWTLALWQATRQAEKYKHAKEQRELIQMRIFALQKLQNGQQEAHVQREIEILQDHVSSLNFKIEKMDADYEL